MMHVTLNVKHGRRDENLEELFERERQRIVARLKDEPLDRVSLHAELEFSTHRKEGFASLTLDLPSGALNAHARGRSHLQALRGAVEALLVELTRHRERARERAREAGTIRHNGDILPQAG